MTVSYVHEALFMFVDLTVPLWLPKFICGRNLLFSLQITYFPIYILKHLEYMAQGETVLNSLSEIQSANLVVTIILTDDFWIEDIP